MQGELLHTETLANGCVVEHIQEGAYVRVTIWKPDRSLFVSALRSQEYIETDPHYRAGIQEQAAGLLLHRTGE